MAETGSRKNTRGEGTKRKYTKPKDMSYLNRNLEKARAKSPIMQAQKAEQSHEYNATTIRFMMEITPKEPLDKKDVAEMERRFQHYLDTCAKYGKKVSNLAAYMAIGTTKDEVREWITQTKTNPERSRFIKKVKEICGVYREQLMADSKVNPVTGIFWQKNYDGFRDQTEITVAPTNPLDDTKSTEELAKKYADAAYIDSTATEVKEISEKSQKAEKVAESRRKGTRKPKVKSE